MLVEGSSMSSVSRVLGIDMNTVVKLLIDAGEVCVDLHDKMVQNVHARYVQVDEAWSYIYSRNSETDGHDWSGTVWNWIAIDTDTKLVISWLAGNRSLDSAIGLMRSLESRLANRIQLSTDGLRAYPEAVEVAFRGNVDYYQRGTPLPSSVIGKPNIDEISSAFVERQNLTMRMSLKRMARQTNAFSKKMQNHVYALATYFVYYNFIRTHLSLGTTPAVAAGLVEYPFDLHWLVEEMNSRVPPQVRGPYRKRVAVQNS